MRRDQRSFLGTSISTLAALMLSQSLLAQAPLDSKTAGLPTDWSHHRVIFSKPATAEQARRLEKDPRYRQQQLRESGAKFAPVKGDPLGAELRSSARALAGKNPKLKRDWSQNMGNGANVGAGTYPAKFSFSPTTANCASDPQPDFVVYGTGLKGAAAQANIVAYDNIYSGCSGTVPTVYWAYNTSDGVVTTSPVFSRDGSQLAFVQTNTAGEAVLVLLKWAASATETVTNPKPMLRVPNANYPGCSAPCMTSEFLKDVSGTNNNPDTHSSIFYDYSSDTGYVGDDLGLLHKISPMFNGVPGEVRSGGWPVQLAVFPVAPTALTSPVLDSGLGFVYAADAGGFLYRIGPNSAFVVSSGQLDVSLAEGGPGIVDSPMVDSTAGIVYVFAASDGSADCASGADCTAVYHLSTSFAGGNIGTEAVVGNSTMSGSAPSPLYDGDFDSNYKNSGTATGNLYVCGNTGGNPTLYQVSVQAGALAVVTQGPVLSTAATTCSPITDILNPNVSGGSTEWIFASAGAGGTSTACLAGGCVYNFKDTPWLSSTAYAVGQEILDSHFHIQVVTTSGTSGLSVPSWQGLPGKFTTDGTGVWLDQGLQSATTPAAWQPAHLYAKNAKILDTSNNIQLVTSSGSRTSGGTIPTFNSTPGGTTTDGAGGLVWTNVGPIATAALPAAGGTSAIIIDNTVGSGTLAGASEIYFSTLSNQACGTSGTGGCAVQASQPALQ